MNHVNSHLRYYIKNTGRLNRFVGKFMVKKAHLSEKKTLAAF